MTYTFKSLEVFLQAYLSRELDDERRKAKAKMIYDAFVAPDSKRLFTKAMDKNSFCEGLLCCPKAEWLGHYLAQNVTCFDKTCYI